MIDLRNNSSRVRRIERFSGDHLRKNIVWG
jgi:hypothetical protein